ncbi:MAG: cytochrome ubiquinol oxidase subunit I [Myxococcota bacterium]
MELDVVVLARAQFAFTVMFHYLFPPLSIGLGGMLVFFEAIYLRTGDKDYETLTRFFTKIFAVNFALGVASGIVMEFQFGTNWSTYSRFVGDVFGSALASEGIFAFFLESGFLAVLVFGWDRVSPRMHFFSACMVWLGSIFSAVWIVIANSWQQTPAGFHVVGEGANARAEITDFWALVFNPSSMDRLVHVILGSFLTGAFVVMSITAYYVLKGRHLQLARKAFNVALIYGFVTAVAIGASGHSQAQLLHTTQPAKLAAFEGHFETGDGGASMTLIGYPDAKAKKTHFAVSVPNLLSFLVHSDPNEPVKGLDQFPESDWPPLVVPFFAYRMMVGLGVFMLALTGLGLFLRWRGTLIENRFMMKIFVGAVFAPYIANQTGWVSAEVGRQPWVVYGLLRTKDAVSPSVSGGETLTSIIMFGLIYLLLGAVWVFVMNSKIQHGPESSSRPLDDEESSGFLEAARDIHGNPAYSLTDARGES